LETWEKLRPLACVDADFGVVSRGGLKIVAASGIGVPQRSLLGATELETSGGPRERLSKGMVENVLARRVMSFDYDRAELVMAIPGTAVRMGKDP
jgi:hypothetical protein